MPFVYHQDRLFCRRGEALLDLNGYLADREEPFYLYDLEDVRDRVRRFKLHLRDDGQAFYAVKANSNADLLRLMAEESIGADVVSIGEFKLALAQGIKAQQIVFSGVGKSSRELDEALALNVGQINVESLPELKRIAEIAGRKKVKAPVALRINPNIHVETHPHIRTGHEENKFGLPEENLAECIEVLRQNSDCLEFRGLAIHVGSQLMNLEPLKAAATSLKNWANRFTEQQLVSKTLDIGGGLGIDYSKDASAEDLLRIDAYVSTMVNLLKGSGAKVLFEPGRILVARSGVLFTRVEYVKQTSKRRFVIVNTGLHHLLRPALYQAVHRIAPYRRDMAAPVWDCDVVGPLCESSDVLAKGIKLTAVKEGDWLAILDAGAYGRVMASQYNARPLPDEVVI